jgi:hypothetical protein
VEEIGAFVVRHKFRFIDFALVISGFVLVLYAGLTLDIFANSSNHTPAAEALEFDELVAALVALFLGLVWAVRRLLRERRRITERATVEREMRMSRDAC